MGFDDDFIRALDNSEETEKAILRVYARGKEGEVIIYSQEIPDERTFKQLYLPTLDRTLHATFAGYSPDRVRYLKFEINSLTREELSKLDYDFTDSGWDKDVIVG